jgi:hypothetical protein
MDLAKTCAQTVVLVRDTLERYPIILLLRFFDVINSSYCDTEEPSEHPNKPLP